MVWHNQKDNIINKQQKCPFNVIQLDSIQTAAKFWYPVPPKYNRWRADGIYPCWSSAATVNVFDLMPDAALF